MSQQYITMFQQHLTCISNVWHFAIIMTFAQQKWHLDINSQNMTKESKKTSPFRNCDNLTQICFQDKLVKSMLDYVSDVISLSRISNYKACSLLAKPFMQKRTHCFYLILSSGSLESYILLSFLSSCVWFGKVFYNCLDK